MTSQSIHHEIHGNSGPWLVFVHGLTCTASDWTRQVATFQATHRCLAVDLRGHGCSHRLGGPYDIETLAADVVRLCDRLSIERAVLIGHSMGTRVIAAAALQAPELASALVFIDGSRQGEGDPVAARSAVERLFGDPEEGARFVRNMFSQMFNERSDPDARQAIVARALDMPVARISALMSNMAAWDAGRMPCVMAQIRLPIMVVQTTSLDAARRRVSLETGQSTPYLDLLRDCVPQAEIRVLAETGHFPQIDTPDVIDEAIRRCIAPG